MQQFYNYECRLYIIVRPKVYLMFFSAIYIEWDLYISDQRCKRDCGRKDDFTRFYDLWTRNSSRYRNEG